MSNAASISSSEDRRSRHRDGRSGGGRRSHKRPFYARVWFWVVIVLVLLIAGAAAWAALLAPKVFAARDSLTAALPLATQAKQQMLDGDREAAEATSVQLAELSADARAQTDTVLWTGLEWVPVVGPNLAAVRVASESVDTLVSDVVAPVSQLELSSIKQSGGINLEVLSDAAQTVEVASASVDQITEEVDGLRRAGLVSEVEQGIDKLAESANELQVALDPARTALQVLPSALGADGQRSYLLLFQNNAEARATGGNPASIMRVTFTDGRVEIAEQASSVDFVNARPEPIVELDPATTALFDDKIARYVQDVTHTPDFAESSRIAQAFWAESFGTPVDGVISFDPVALSYLVEATGPVQTPTGETITAENAVSLLLNEVYSLYPEPADQDEFFSGVASLVFEQLVSGDADLRALLPPLARAVDEGRLMFSPNAPELAALIEGTPLAGSLPTINDDETVLGVYVNSTTEGKIEYYAQLDITASSTQCTAPDAPEFVVTADYTNTLTPEQARALPRYISTGRYVTQGDMRTDLVFYGPVGSSFVSAEMGGSAVSDGKLVVTEHLGRPAVRVIDAYAMPGKTAQVTVRFSGGAQAFGELDVRHTPMVRPVGLTVDSPDC